MPGTVAEPTANNAAPKVGFFDYFNRGKSEGLTDTEAYRWAIIEDLFDADDHPITKDEATADGLCFHPQYAVETLGQITRYDKYHTCAVCGVMLELMWVGPNCHEEKYYYSKPVKIMTRSEQFIAFLKSGKEL